MVQYHRSPTAVQIVFSLASNVHTAATPRLKLRSVTRRPSFRGLCSSSSSLSFPKHSRVKHAFASCPVIVCRLDDRDPVVYQNGPASSTPVTTSAVALCRIFWGIAERYRPLRDPLKQLRFARRVQEPVLRLVSVFFFFSWKDTLMVVFRKVVDCGSTEISRQGRPWSRAGWRLTHLVSCCRLTCSCRCLADRDARDIFLGGGRVGGLHGFRPY